MSNKNKPSNHLSLAPYCQFVTGSKRAAIYNLKKKLVFSLNNKARKIIEGSEPDNFGFWNKLVKMGLAFPHSESTKLKKTPPPKQGLEFIWLELTARCNLRCIHCYADAENSSKINKDLNPQFWQRIIKEGAELGCRKLQFIGGEPLLYPGLFELATYAQKQGYKLIEICTNTTLLTRERVKIIKKLKIGIVASIFSSQPEIHERVTGIKGSFSKFQQSLKMLKEAKVPLRIALVIMKQNQTTVKETLNFLRKMGFGPKIDVIRPTGRGSCPSIMPDLVVVKKWSFLSKPDFPTNKKEFFRNQYWNSCWAGKICVTSEGKVIPCVFARNHLVADLRKKTNLKKAVFGKKLQKLWKITKDKVKVCKDCEYRYACRDCRPLAEATSKDLYAKYPRCTYSPYLGKWQRGGEK